MKTKTVKHYLMYYFDQRFMSEPSYFYSNLNMTTLGDAYAVIKEVDFEIVIPEDFDPRKQMIATLEAQQQKARADFELLMNTLDGKIQSLKCIEHVAE